MLTQFSASLHESLINYEPGLLTRCTQRTQGTSGVPDKNTSPKTYLADHLTRPNWGMPTKTGLLASKMPRPQNRGKGGGTFQIKETTEN